MDDIGGWDCHITMLILWIGSGPAFPLTPANFDLQRQCRKLFGSAMQGLPCPSSFLPQSADGLSSLSGFLCSLTMGKGFDLVVLSVIAGAPGSYTPPLSHSENILSGRGGQPSPPSWKSLFVVVQCSFAKGKCFCGSLWNSSASSGLLN